MNLKATGERFIPEAYHGEIAAEHYHRYLFARELVADRDVLDIACGQGYGSALMASTARRVTGVDVAIEVIHYARKTYNTNERLSFLVGEATHIPLPDASVDVVVSFETIEHIVEHAEMMREIKRVLRPDGMLIMSSPDKYRYSVLTGYTNPFHTKELFADEFAAMIGTYFTYVALGGQRSMFGSGLFFLEGNTAALSFERNGDGFETAAGIPAAMYCIAVASDAPLPTLFNGVYIDTVTSSDAVVNVERRLNERETELSRLNDRHNQLVHERDRLVHDHETELGHLNDQLCRLVEERNHVERRLNERETELSRLNDRHNQLVHERDRLASELGLTQRALTDVQKRVEAAIAYAESADQRARALENSTIWRATKPFRDVVTPFSKLRRQLRGALRVIYRFHRGIHHKPVEKPSQTGYSPLVSVIVPNFNHARFLSQRIDSILGQSYKNIELLLLDDASTDDSMTVIEHYHATHPSLVRVLRNEFNSGNVFRQWRKGIAAANGDLIWICESDDFAEPDFLERLVPIFLDESVMLAFGRVQATDAAGFPQEGLDAYRERAQPGIWDSSNKRPAKAWFDTAFGVANVIPNVGGCLIRNQPIEEAVWLEATTYRILGDWYLYVMLAGGGRIAYEPHATSYFRQHGSNTSTSGFSTAQYYQEHERLICLLRERWGVPAETVERFAQQVHAQFEWAKATDKIGALETVFDHRKALEVPRSGRHILMVILGFYLGGGEIFPIHLANHLVKDGYIVSILALQSERWNKHIRDRLDRRIAVYHAEEVRRIGVANFITAAGVDIIHSHFIGGEGLFFIERHNQINIPYIVTLHGSYECSELDEVFVRNVISRVDHWVYLTYRNITHLRAFPVAEKFTISASHIPNAMPLDMRPFELDRASLAIGKDDLVFALVSRAIPPKGWGPAIEALNIAQTATNRRLVLLLCGDGEEADRLRPLHAGNSAVRFLGFQDRIHGLYRLADCALLPTRFPGESYPLTLIQAMQVGTPIISTDVGEIRAISQPPGRRAGLLVPPFPDDSRFVAALAEAMLTMTDDHTRSQFGRDASVLGQIYQMETVAAAYTECYEMVLTRHARSRVSGDVEISVAASPV